jgi:hypothetical protein
MLPLGMTTPDQCPFCGSRQLFPGAIKSTGWYTFRPNEAHATIFHIASVDGIDFGPRAHLCAQCGMVWGRANRQKARDFIESYGSEVAQAKLQDTG